MKIVYIPLDERPCNTDYPIRTITAKGDVDCMSLPKSLMGYKKTAGNREEIWQFLKQAVADADYAVISAEMLLYGGLLASRLHHLPMSELHSYEEKIRQLKMENPKLKLYFSNLIMRTPKYDSADEEPDYYEAYGAKIFRHGWLQDKQQREGLSEKEAAELVQLQNTIPTSFIEDYEGRRAFNVAADLLHVRLVEAGIIDFLAIPQDDSAPYGYTAIDQKKVYGAISEKNLKDQIMVYPGADEVGFTLLARGYNDYQQKAPKLFVHFSSTLGPTLVPLYEDRIINESLKAHVMAAGMRLTTNRQEADVILAYNTPGKVMQESWDQVTQKDVTYDSYRHLLTFLQEIKDDLSLKKPVGICDSAYANGGDLELVGLLDKWGLLEHLACYKAWNTNCNSLGSALCGLTFATNQESLNRHQLDNLVSSLYEDVFYQALVRRQTTEKLLPGLGKNYFDIAGNEEQVTAYVKAELLKCGERWLKNSFKDKALVFKELSFPWKRMFECNCQLTLTEK